MNTVPVRMDTAFTYASPADILRRVQGGATVTADYANRVQRELQSLAGDWDEFFPHVAVSYATGCREGIDEHPKLDEPLEYA